MILKRKISCLIVLALIMSTLSQVLLWNNVLADDTIYYSQDFGSVEGVAPAGWTIPNNSSYIKFNSSDKSPAGAMESVSGVALNAVASGYGNRSAYVNISSDILAQENMQYVTIDFDFYMQGGVNTCNIFTLGSNQSDSYTDLSNTFFALGNGDGVGARNTLRYYNYNTDSWVSISDANDKWLSVQIFVDITNKKMGFHLKRSDGSDAGTYGPFSFNDSFTSTNSILNRIVMSGFRTNGGSVSLNTWVDNFKIHSMNEDNIRFISYNGLTPLGEINSDFSFVDYNNESVLKVINSSPIDDISSDVDLVRVIDTDFMITALPTSGYLSILNFDNSAKGGVMIDKKGRLVNQYSGSSYINMLENKEKISINQWYNIKGYVYLTTSTEKAYYTFVITGDFGNGSTTREYVYETRNSNSFTKLNLYIGGILENSSCSGYTLFKNMSLSAVERPNIQFVYNSNGNVLVNNTVITNGTIYQNTVPKFVQFMPNDDYDLNSITSNTDNIYDKISINILTGGYNYNIPLKDEDIIINITFGEFNDSIITTTQINEPYSVDPTQPWETRKYASEARTLEIKDAKMAYRLYKPVGYNENPNQTYPLVVSLRALGDDNTGFDNTPYTAGHIEDILTAGDNAYDFPCFILSPQCYNEQWLADNYTNIAMVLDIIDRLTDEFNIDTDRIYIGGLSGGAQATWIALNIRPNFFAGAFIMSGTALDTSYANRYVNTPIWTFYAADDSAQRVPSTNRAMVEAVNNLGGNIISTEYNNGGHIISWQSGLRSPLFKWLFLQKKGNTITDSYVNRLINDYNNSIGTELNFGFSLGQDINNDNCNIQETELGDIITDAMRNCTDADIAFINSGDLGSSISSGQVQEEDILNAIPSNLNVSVIELTGADILTLLTNSLTYYPVPDGRFLQMSGLEVDFDSSLIPSQRIQSVLVNGVELDTEKTYTVAITSHLLSNNLNNTYNGDFTVLDEYYQTIAQMFVSYTNSNQNNVFNNLGNRINNT